MVPVMDASLVDTTLLLALRLCSWGGVGMALAVLAGAVLWEICCTLESGHQSC